MSLNLDITHSTQRQYTIVHGVCKDHAGSVTVHPLPDFDLDTTIFTTLEGKIPRLFMTAKIAKEAVWNTDAQEAIHSAYTNLRASFEAPAISPELIQFMENDCNFSA